MIFIWMPQLSRMIYFSSFEEYWGSLSYEILKENIGGYGEIFVEKNTPLWKVKND